jgi:2-polyprenyl-3-methyl-5-hydroxy-6-metoxy-1,4-benzoquinol methylase/predicted transcriptional regulator
MTTTVAAPSPELFFETLQSYQRTAALRAAIELDLFTAIGNGAQSATDIAAACNASVRGTRILCDYLTIRGLLVKTDDAYQLTPDSSVFLTKQSPAYLGSVIAFLSAPPIVGAFDNLAATIRKGGVSVDESTVADENPVWETFARAMMPMMMPAAQAIAGILDVASAGPMRVLDIAAGHGIFGVVVAQQNPRAEVVAVDWKGVLQVATENASAMGVGDRHQTLPGDAFKVELGTGFDLALVTNFLHHFDVPTNTALLARIAAALKPGGRVAVLEFVPNDDRVSPPSAASFAMQMLAGTPAGDAYTFNQLTAMLEAAGFSDVTAHPLQGPETVVVGTR